MPHVQPALAALLRELYDQERRVHPIRSLFRPAKVPTLAFRVAPLPSRAAAPVAHALMPPTMIAPPKLAYALAAFRMALAHALALAHDTDDVGRRESPPPHSALADAALAAFAAVLDDAPLLAAFMTKWEARLGELSQAQVIHARRTQR